MSRTLQLLWWFPWYFATYAWWSWSFSFFHFFCWGLPHKKWWPCGWFPLWYFAHCGDEFAKHICPFSFGGDLSKTKVDLKHRNFLWQEKIQDRRQASGRRTPPPTYTCKQNSREFFLINFIHFIVFTDYFGIFFSAVGHLSGKTSQMVCKNRIVLHHFLIFIRR